MVLTAIDRNVFYFYKKQQWNHWIQRCAEYNKINITKYNTEHPPQQLMMVFGTPFKIQNIIDMILIYQNFMNKKSTEQMFFWDHY